MDKKAVSAKGVDGDYCMVCGGEYGII